MLSNCDNPLLVIFHLSIELVSSRDRCEAAKSWFRQESHYGCPFPSELSGENQRSGKSVFGLEVAVGRNPSQAVPEPAFADFSGQSTASSENRSFI